MLDLLDILGDLVGPLMGLLFSPVALVALFVVFMMHSDKKHREFLANQEKQKAKITPAESKPGDVVPTTTTNSPATAPAVQPKPKDPYASMNVLLYVGSILLVIAVESFTTSTNGAMVAPITMILTLIFYILGFCLFKLVDYLKPVGKAFAYSALAIFPIWGFCLASLGIPDHAAAITATCISLIMFGFTAIMFNSKGCSVFAYIALYVLSFVSVPETDSNTISLYWFMTAPMVIGLIPAVLWALKPNWLPVCFRKATQVFAMLITPFSFFPGALLYLAPGAAVEVPALRSVMAALLLVWMLLFYFADKAYGMFIASRFCAQLLVFAIVADSLNYSIIPESFDSNTNHVGQLAAILVWAFGFLAQALISLFVPKKSKTEESAEHVAEVVSLVGLFITPIFTVGLGDTLASIVQIAVAVGIAVLGIAYTLVHKKSTWSLATIFALFYIPIAITIGFDVSHWAGWFVYICYTIIGVAIIVMHKLFAKYGENEMLNCTTIGIAITSMFIVLAMMGEGYAEVGFLTVSLFLAILGIIAKKKVLFEVSIYMAAMALIKVVETITGLIETNIPQKAITNCAPSSYRNCLMKDPTPELVCRTIQALIGGGVFIATSAWKEKETSNKPRFVTGYIIATFMLFTVGASGGGAWMVPALIEQTAFLIYAALTDREWLIWTSVAVLPFTTLILTGGANYIWFGVIGIILISVVIWRATKMHAAEVRKQQQSDQKNIETPKE